LTPSSSSRGRLPEEALKNRGAKRDVPHVPKKEASVEEAASACPQGGRRVLGAVDVKKKRAWSVETFYCNSV
jgi:hypothetical protein